MKIKEIISKWKSLWLLHKIKKLSLSIPFEMSQGQCGEYAYLGLKGLKKELCQPLMRNVSAYLALITSVE